ncbi:hypothetical protein D9M70_601130 [compost metagenome]
MRHGLRVEAREAAAECGRERVEGNAEDAAVALLRRHVALDVQLVGEHGVHHLLALRGLPDHLALRVAQRLHPALHIRHQQHRSDHGLRPGIGLGQFARGLLLAVAAGAVQVVDPRQRDAQHQQQEEQAGHLDQHRRLQGLQQLKHGFLPSFPGFS